MNEDVFRNGRSISFWQLIQYHAIRIPAIQRDYVYGQPSASSVRSGILDEVATHLEDNTRLSLNFIYGEIEDNPEDRDVPICKPLDGQQRLTTLYFIYWNSLVHVHAAHPEVNITEATDTLSRFSYDTRQTAKDFFELITQQRTIDDIAEWMQNPDGNECSHLSQLIREKHWFRPDFSYDPTIISALVVLDEIQERPILSEYRSWRLLTESDCPIRFEWLDIKDIGNGDDLYIKMNARGKQLSVFDNFKAEFEDASKKLVSEEDYFKLCQKIDGPWMDFFWNTAKETAEPSALYDTYYMRFLNWSLWNRWAEKVEASQVDASSKKIPDQGDIENRHLADYECILPEGQNTMCAKTLETLSHYLNYISQDDAIDGIVNAARQVSISKPRQTEYADRMRLESAMAYINGMYNLGEKPNQTSWKQWNRIISHLSNAAQIWQGYNSPAQYTRAVKAVELFQSYADNLTAYFAGFPDVQGFNPHDQIEEEELKSWLIVNNNDWAKAIESAEEIKYFKGKIGFLFDFVDINKDTRHTALDDPEKLDKFNQYVSVAAALFPDKEPDELSISLHRALLTKGDYSLHEGTVSSYLTRASSFTRSISWKALLRSKDNYRKHEVRNKEYLMRDLFDDIIARLLNCDHPSTSQAIKVLNDIIAAYRWTDGERDDWWAQWLIKYPELWSGNYFGTLKQFRVEDGICYLPRITNTQLKSLNKELVSCAIGAIIASEVPGVVCYPQEMRGRLYPDWDYDSIPPYVILENENLKVGIGRIYKDKYPSQGHKFPEIWVICQNTSEQNETDQHEKCFTNAKEVIHFVKQIFIQNQS
ncbi:DUF262 domain-containing protein [Bifidobacterium sp. ESL0704]|uniref:DUF262 domain-containing protein n=1 Tax=Bifidobacterium sp. ESL0704 TaxID=2983219 RepID=UPI0023F829A5|nr:DUF262 domain-containing protein [Bifidobacterium sp. ESL0704]WEV52235.1 DUF262 domain-containing protein [Bifidobacterium sp. ESL0704]